MSDAETGVGAILCIAHRARTGGDLHGHSYEVVAWFSEPGGDALHLQRLLRDCLDVLDHKIANPGRSTGEEIAVWVKKNFISGGFDCVQVEVRRPLERIYARTRG